MGEWDKIEKALSSPLKRIEFVAALTPIQPYRAAKEFSNKGFVSDKSVVLVDYSRLTNKEECRKRYELSDSLYVILEKEEVGGRIRRKIQANFDYVLGTFMREKLGIVDDNLISKVVSEVKAFFANKVFEPKIQDKEAFMNTLASLPLPIILVGIVLALTHYSDKLSSEEKELIEKRAYALMREYFTSVIQLLSLIVREDIMKRLAEPLKESSRAAIAKPFFDLAHEFFRRGFEVLSKAEEVVESKNEESSQGDCERQGKEKKK